jgi:hypothetical protein
MCSARTLTEPGEDPRFNTTSFSYQHFKIRLRGLDRWVLRKDELTGRMHVESARQISHRAQELETTHRRPLEALEVWHMCTRSSLSVAGRDFASDIVGFRR